MGRGCHHMYPHPGCLYCASTFIYADERARPYKQRIKATRALIDELEAAHDIHPTHAARLRSSLDA